MSTPTITDYQQQASDDLRLINKQQAEITALRARNHALRARNHALRDALKTHGYVLDRIAADPACEERYRINCRNISHALRIFFERVGA